MKLRTLVLTAMLAVLASFSTLAAAQTAASQAVGPIWIAMPASSAVMQSLEVKAAAKGNIIVTVTGTVNYEHTQGNQGAYCLQLSQTSGYTGGCVPDGGSDSAVRSFIASDMPTTVSGFGASEQYSIVRSWPVTAGTTYTFYLNGYASGFNAAYLFQPSITAIFVPGTLAQ
jgi:hypothetical protein